MNQSRPVLLLMVGVAILAVTGAITELFAGHLFAGVFPLALVAFGSWRLSRAKDAQSSTAPPSKQHLALLAVGWALIGILCLVASLFFYSPQLVVRVVGVGAGTGALYLSLRAFQAVKRSI